MFKNRFLISFLLLVAVSFMSYAEINSLIIPAYAFYPMRFDTEWYASWGEIHIKFSPTNPEGKLRAPVFLPEGAVIKKVILRYKLSEEPVITMTLYRRNMYTDVEQIVASITAPLAVDYMNLATYSIAYRTVNNGGYCYYIVIDIPPGPTYPRIAGVKILYE